MQSSRRCLGALVGMAWYDGMKEPRLMICPISQDGNRSENRSGEGCILSLIHPKSGNSTWYMLKDGLLQEFNWFKQSYGSWFLGDYVCEDGSLYISTPVDPIFIFLPIFCNARLKKGKEQGMFRQIDEILFNNDYPSYQCLVSLAEQSMQLVCEVKEIGSLKFFRLDDSKVLSWLCCKVQHLKTALIKLDKNYAAQEEKETLKEAVSILGEYLKDEPWLRLLCSHLKLDLNETMKESPRMEDDLLFPEKSVASSHPHKGKGGTAWTSNGKQSKKLKAETDSHNIKDMFRRISRRAP
ncbi:ribonuclease H2 subunit B isoform X1 [Dendrobium catenatum]|uniref:ribonuclease H2 subunit B isoform X1 n=1 Tax=Dendrobium catenatum TaxID=906689 RepID=UPI0009F5EB4D|nr:ribonuclease H2 subunit B isoform X1 [Dendrobium catenatum]